jgi:hypothetical protein
MTSPALRHSSSVALAASLLAATAAAQWPSTPSPNFSVADRRGEQVLPKIAATSDGGCYIGWFDQFSGNYEVRLQRLDARGVELWPRQGILISANPQSSSLVDWDLLCDRDDHCVLAFTDTRAGSDLDVYAYRVDPSGALVWGANGITLSNNSDYEPSPKLCETSDGHFVCAWANTGAADLRVQRIDRAGNLLYPANGRSVPGDAGAVPAFCRLVAADNGGFILSWVRALAFNGLKHVHAQKFDAAGAPLWGGGTRLPIFDQASVPIAHEPRLLADGSGGAIFAWHFALGQSFSVRAQRVLANGTEVFPHNGVDACTNASSKFDPALAWHVPSQSLYVAWNERNLAQSQWGISLQKLDAAGTRLFGGSGVVLLPVNGVVKYAPVCAPVGEGAVCTVLEESLGGQSDKLRSFRVSATGQLVWNTPIDVSLFVSDKLRLSNTVTPSGVVLNVWTDLRQDNGDVVAQNLNPRWHARRRHGDQHAVRLQRQSRGQPQRARSRRDRNATPVGHRQSPRHAVSRSAGPALPRHAARSELALRHAHPRLRHERPGRDRREPDRLRLAVYLAHRWPLGRRRTAGRVRAAGAVLRGLRGGDGLRAGPDDRSRAAGDRGARAHECAADRSGLLSSVALSSVVPCAHLR